MVPAQYHNFRDVFSKEAFDELPPQKAWDHAIDLSPGTELPCSQMFPLSPTEQKELDDFLLENLVNGRIHPSKSPMGAPVFFIKKKDGSLCLVQDYQKVNEIMVKNIYSLTLSDPQQTVCQVLTALHKWRLFLKPEKCKFEQKEVEYLELVILKDHVAMDPTKVRRVTEWPTPTKVKEVQSFLGFVNFYQKFICDFSNVTCPLYVLTRKTQQWVWGSPEQEAFNALKKAITSAPILPFPSQSGCFCLKCDTSNFATRAVLSQAQADGMHQPIAFMSKGFSDVEHNYQIHNKEMLAIMHALDEWHHFLEGATEKFEILMDH